MLRGLYRFYLYTVFIAMLIFAAFGIQPLLQTLLQQTLHIYPYLQPSTASLIQASVLAVVSWLTAALFGGLHYWLIRRDLRQEPVAANGSIRAFFLNFVEAIFLLVAVGVGAGAISGLGQQFNPGVSGQLSFAIPMLLVAGALEWERRRTQAGPGAPIVLQRIHLYGAQLILLFLLAPSWLSNVGQIADVLFYGGKGTNSSLCGGFKVCDGPNLLSLVASTVFLILFWLGYSRLSAGDTASRLRRALHLIGFGFGLIFALIGIYHGLQLAILSILNVSLPASSLAGPFAQYDIVSYLSLGLVTAGVYARWLYTASSNAQERASVLMILHAIACALLGIAFWWGTWQLLLTLLEKAFPSQTPIGPQDWANCIALVITGIAYIPLGLLLRRLTAQRAYIAPLRGFTFAMLGIGILASAIGGASALYAYATSLLGSPLANWPYTAHQGFAAFVAGIIIVGLYLWTSIHENFFNIGPQQRLVATTASSASETVSTAPTDGTPITTTIAQGGSGSTAATTLAITSLDVEEIVDALLAGKISRDEGVARLDKLARRRL